MYTRVRHPRSALERMPSGTDWFWAAASWWCYRFTSISFVKLMASKLRMLQCASFGIVQSRMLRCAFVSIFGRVHSRMLQCALSVIRCSFTPVTANLRLRYRMVGALVNERCNLVRVLDPVREGRSNKLALNLIFSVKADTSKFCLSVDRTL